MLQPPHNKEAGLVLCWIVTEAIYTLGFPPVLTFHALDGLRKTALFTAPGDLVLSRVEAEDGEKEGTVAGVGSYKGVFPIRLS